MFDEKMKQDYKAVTAPEELKATLMKEFSSHSFQRRKTNYRFFKYAIGVMACSIVLLIAGIIGLRQSTDRVKINILGNTVSDEPMVARFVEDETKNIIIPMWVDAERKTTIKASAGTLQVYDSETKELVGEGSTWKGKGSVLIQWEINGENVADYELTVKEHGRDVIYNLQCENDEWSLVKK